VTARSKCYEHCLLLYAGQNWVLAQLRDDLDRFIFLLGGNDGENLLACGS
jgi:hypothetical protein